MNITAKSVEEYIDFLTKNKGSKSSNITLKEFNISYHSDLQQADYGGFINSGDYCYFVARILFLKGLGIIAFTLAHQAIENYLKAYLKYSVKQIAQGHDLLALLNKCIKIAPTTSFLHSARANTIVCRFDPFYELPRYPVQKHRPKGGSYAYLMPDDIYPLDYFIKKMREEMPLPQGVWDIFKQDLPFGTSLFKGQLGSDELINMFKANNINF